MIIQATPYGTKKEESFAFTYSGDFTDSRVDGIGDVTFNTSGQFVTSGKTVRVTVHILGAGGGGAFSANRPTSAELQYGYGSSGGGGGIQTVQLELIPGTYEIVIGTGGVSAIAYNNNVATGGTGGNTTAFGYTSTGGTGGMSWKYNNSWSAGIGGSPDGGNGSYVQGKKVAAGGSPNGGSVANYTPQNGGNGLVRITFS